MLIFLFPAKFPFSAGSIIPQQWPSCLQEPPDLQQVEQLLSSEFLGGIQRNKSKYSAFAVLSGGAVTVQEQSWGGIHWNCELSSFPVQRKSWKNGSRTGCKWDLVVVPCVWMKRWFLQKPGDPWGRVRDKSVPSPWKRRIPSFPFSATLLHSEEGEKISSAAPKCCF